MGVVVLSAGCSWVLPEPLPFNAEIVQDAMVEDAAPPRPDFGIARPVDLGQRFDMRARRMDRGVPIDEGVEVDMTPEVDEGFAEMDEAVIEADMDAVDQGVDARPDLAIETDMHFDMSLEPPEQEP
ncbi:MAG: hypothetical protein ACI9U2_001097 [Bradymonadia bacterium]|jgi:hypothetical protein